MGPQTPDQIPGDKKPRKERKKLRETTRVVSVQFPSCCFTSSHCPTDASKTGFIWIFFQLPLHSLLTHSLFTFFRFCSAYGSYSSYFVSNETSLVFDAFSPSFCSSHTRTNMNILFMHHEIFSQEKRVATACDNDSLKYTKYPIEHLLSSL